MGPRGALSISQSKLIISFDRKVANSQPVLSKDLSAKHSGYLPQRQNFSQQSKIESRRSSLLPLLRAELAYSFFIEFTTALVKGEHEVGLELAMVEKFLRTDRIISLVCGETRNCHRQRYFGGNESQLMKWLCFIFICKPLGSP